MCQQLGVFCGLRGRLSDREAEAKPQAAQHLALSILSSPVRNKRCRVRHLTVGEMEAFLKKVSPSRSQKRSPRTESTEDHKVQREDQGAPDHMDPQAHGEFGTARKAMKRLPTKRAGRG